MHTEGQATTNAAGRMALCFEMCVPGRSATCPGVLEFDELGYVFFDKAFQVWNMYAPRGCRGPEDVAQEAAVTGGRLLLPPANAFHDKTRRFHPALFEPILRTLNGSDEPCAGDDDTNAIAVFACRRAGELLDQRWVKWFDPSYKLAAGERAFSTTPYKRPWHAHRPWVSKDDQLLFNAADFLAVLGTTWNAFRDDTANAQTANELGIDLEECGHGAQTPCCLASLLVMWARAQGDAAMRAAVPPATRRATSRLQLTDVADEPGNGWREVSNIRFQMQKQDDLLTSVLGPDNRPILTIRPSDGYVWISSLLNRFDKRMAHFKLNADNMSYVRLAAEELGVDASDLIKKECSPFDNRAGHWVHMEILSKVVAWVHRPFERLCHNIALRFYAGQITTAQSQSAANSIANRLGFGFGESTDRQAIRDVITARDRSEAAHAATQVELERALKIVRSRRDAAAEAEQDAAYHAERRKEAEHALESAKKDAHCQTRQRKQAEEARKIAEEDAAYEAQLRNEAEEARDTATRALRAANRKLCACRDILKECE